MAKKAVNQEPHPRVIDYADAILAHLKEKGVATKAELVSLLENEFSGDFTPDEETPGKKPKAANATVKKFQTNVGHAKAWLTRHNRTITIGELVCIEPECQGNLSALGDLCRCDEAKEIIEKVLAYVQVVKEQASTEAEAE